MAIPMNAGRMYQAEPHVGAIIHETYLHQLPTLDSRM